MKKQILILSHLLVLFLGLFSCKKDKETISNQQPTSRIDSKENDSLIQKIDSSGAGYFAKSSINNHAPTRFPNFGQKAEDFIRDPAVYEIQLEAKGDLNNDHLDDLVVVIRNKTNKLAERTLLVLLKNKDGYYHLDKISNKVIPIEYNQADHKMYGTEDISINNGVLSINLYDIGPNGNLESNFRYFGDELLLTYIETYNMGAGSHLALYYDITKAILTVDEINTMEEEMPTKTSKYNLKKVKYRIEEASPDDIMSRAYNQTSGE